MVVSCLNIQAQNDSARIIEDKQEESGNRTIFTNDVLFAKGKDKNGIESDESLNLAYFRYFIKNGESIDRYSICIPRTSFIRMTLAKGRKLLLKLDNDSIITLRTQAEIRSYDNCYSPSLNCYKVDYIYPATENDLRKIKNSKVLKIRMEEDDGFTDMTPTEYNEQFNFSERIHECFDLIQSALKKSNSVYDNF